MPVISKMALLTTDTDTRGA